MLVGFAALGVYYGEEAFLCAQWFVEGVVIAPPTFVGFGLLDQELVLWGGVVEVSDGALGYHCMQLAGL
jgi:hypothetical protein